MLQKSVTELKEEIDRLEKHYVFSTNEMQRLTQVLVEKTCEYETQTKKLNSFQREFALTDRKYQAAKNRILFLKKVIPPLENDLKHINIELHESEQEFLLLNTQKQLLDDNLSKIQQINNQLSKALLEKESEHNQVLSDIQAAEIEKQRTLYAISDMLSKTSQEHLRSEQELDEFSTDFIRVSGEREIIKSDFNKKRRQIDELTEKAALLESTYLEIKETIALEKSLKHLETELEKIEREAKAEEEELSLLEKEVSESKIALESLSTHNIVNRDSLSALENEVQSYDELALTVQESESRLAESKELIEKAIIDLKTQFKNHIEIQLKKRFSWANFIY